MRSFAALLVLACALAACTAKNDERTGEDFGHAFERMQASPEFLVSRASDRLQVLERFRVGGGEVERMRVIPCGIDAMRAAGWQLLPSASRLAQTGTTYSAPEIAGADRRAVTLGPAEGTADAKYFFERSGGQWQLVRVEVYSHLDPGVPLPPLPCAGGAAPGYARASTPPVDPV